MNPPANGRRLKIAMVIDTYDDSKNGAVISTKRFVSLLKRQHDVTIITTGHPAPGKFLLPEFYPFGFRRVMKRMHVPLAFPRPLKVRRILREHDIIHVQFPFLLGVNAVNIGRKRGIPVVTTFHIQAEHLAMNAGIQSEQFIRYIYKFWLKNIYNKSDMVICPSKFAEDELQAYGLKAPSMVISNGISPIFKPVAVEREPFLKDKFVIISVGRFAPEKNHDLIIEAVSLSRYSDRIQLILIGEGPAREKLVELGKKLHNPPVFLTLSQEELVHYYNVADLYVHAANVEIEGMTVLEAMACGLPLLLAESKKSATKQFALDSRSLYPSGSSQDLAARIDYWIGHPEELAAAKELYHECSKKFRIEQSFNKLIGIYQELVARKTIRS
jgi:glycosyltransferase involved in cell wall biosynthesis